MHTKDTLMMLIKFALLQYPYQKWKISYYERWKKRKKGNYAGLRQIMECQRGPGNSSHHWRFPWNLWVLNRSHLYLNIQGNLRRCRLSQCAKNTLWNQRQHCFRRLSRRLADEWLNLSLMEWSSQLDSLSWFRRYCCRRCRRRRRRRLGRWGLWLSMSSLHSI